MARQKARGKRQEARLKRVWAILRFFTQFGFIVFTYLEDILKVVFRNFHHIATPLSPCKGGKQ
ncbi:hypothetical protein AA650_17615 [Anabaena sp. WA102]|jgi:hypothetical protein|nr:hypothetical protein AA650_17615 [Anabaena sp. WA102]OBQ18774.1 MAG: hypothetical protein AN486_10935 [Anabaena sp. AL93]